MQMIWALLLCLLPITGLAADGMRLQVHVDEQLVSCDAELQSKQVSLRHLLNDGASVQSKWLLHIDTVHRYWLNSRLASIVLRRRVESDLVTRRWLLIDRQTGINHSTKSIEEAIRFLSDLQAYPIIDVSLLDIEQGYNLVVELYIDETDASEEAWWVSWLSWFSPQTFQAIKAFSLP